ncbi:uncharacterized protein [Periplaneta americana]|uniref:uncharacterized protein isoform X2 n=1 Tax=Periplaneta americana TaxID=6978 RepID=UPI0037E7A84C
MSGKLGKKCAVYGCANYEWQKNSRSFFRFPKDKKFCDEWVLMCGRPELHDRYELRGSVSMYNIYKICAEHFLPTDFRNPRQHSQGLKPGTIPSQKLDYNRIQLNKRLNEARILSRKLDCHLIELQNGDITVAIEGLSQQQSIPNDEQCRTLNEGFETKFHKRKIYRIEETVWKENPLFWRHRLNEEVIYSILTHDKEIPLKPGPENKEVGDTTSKCALPTTLGGAAIVEKVKLETDCDVSASGTELNCYLEDDFATVKCEAEDYMETMEAGVPCHLEEDQAWKCYGISNYSNLFLKNSIP